MRKLLIPLLLGLFAFSAANACNLGDIVTKGSTSRSVALDIIDSTDGTPETGVVFNTAGIDLWYRREGAVRTAITEATLAALTTAWSSGGFLHISDGAYRLDVPDAAFATSANYVDIGGTVTGMVVICQRVKLVDTNLEVAAIPANVTQFGGTNLTATGGRPEVNMSHIAGAAVSASTAQLGVNIVNFGGSAGTFASGRPEVNTTNLAGTSLATMTGAYPALGITDSGTAQAGSGTTLQLRATANFVADNRIVGNSCLITGGTGVGESLPVASYVNATDTATMAGTWPTTPDNSSTYICFGTAPGSGSAPTVAQIATGVWQDATAGDFTVANSIGKSLYTGNVVPGGSGGMFIAGSNAATTVNITGTLSTVTTLTNLPTIPANWLTAAGTAPDFSTEIQTGLATASALTTVSGKIDVIDDFLDTEMAAVLAAVDTEVASILSNTGSIKTKTDQLTFGVTNEVNVNIESQNGAALCGVGTVGDKWRACP